MAKTTQIEIGEEKPGGRISSVLSAFKQYLICLLLLTGLGACASVPGPSQPSPENLKQEQRYCLWTLQLTEPSLEYEVTQRLKKGEHLILIGRDLSRRDSRRASITGDCVKGYGLPKEVLDALQTMNPGEVTPAIPQNGRVLFVMASTDAHYRQGLLYYEQRAYDQAVIQFQNDVELHPDSVSSWRMLGLCQAALDKHQEALSAFDRALYFSPDDPFVNKAKAGVLAKIGHTEGALAFYERALLASPNDPESMYGLAQALYKGRTDLEYAERLALRAAESLPGYLEIWRLLSKIAETLGHKTLTVVSLHRAARLSPEDAEISRELTQAMLLLDPDTVGLLQAAPQSLSRPASGYDLTLLSGDQNTPQLGQEIIGSSSALYQGRETVQQSPSAPAAPPPAVGPAPAVEQEKPLPPLPVQLEIAIAKDLADAAPPRQFVATENLRPTAAAAEEPSSVSANQHAPEDASVDHQAYQPSNQSSESTESAAEFPENRNAEQTLAKPAPEPAVSQLSTSAPPAVKEEITKKTEPLPVEPSITETPNSPAAANSTTPQPDANITAQTGSIKNSSQEERYYIQTSSWSKKESALQEIASWRKRGYTAALRELSESELQNKFTYIVEVGPYVSKAKASETAQIFLQWKWIQSFFVHRR